MSIRQWFGRSRATSFDPFLDEGFIDVERIGSGTTSTVYRARETAFNRLTALKVFNVPLSDVVAKRRFERELQVAGSLGAHPNNITLYRTGFLADGRAYVAMELCALGSTASLLQNAGPMAVANAVEIGIRIAGAAQTAHDAGIVHRDIKPQNILLRRGGHPVLADFGVAVFHDDATITTEAMTPAHAAAEVLEGAVATMASDQWSLASTLYELLSGSPPFHQEPDEGPLAWRVRAIEQPLPSLHRSDVPPELFAALERAMSKNAQDRFGSMQEFGEALQDVQRQQDWPATPLEVIDSTEGATPLGESMTPSPGTLIRSALRPESDAVSVANAVEPEKRERRMFLRWFAVAFAALAIAIVLLVIMQGRQHNSEQKQPPAPLPASYEPLDVRITNDTGPTVSLKWTDPNGGAVTYVVDTTLHDVSIGPVQRATAVDSTTIASLDVRERYCFSVGAVYAFGQSPAYADPVCRAE